MSYITGHWSFDPFLILAVVVAAWHEIGLWRLARRSRPERTRQRRLRSLWFYAGLAVLLLAVESPIDYWADDYFFVHMIQHLLLMFAAPSLIVAGAPWQPLLRHALPGRSGRSVTRGVLAGGWSRPLRAVGGFFVRPWVSVALFNAVMIFWHLSGPYDLAENNQAVHIWLMHGSFFAAGVLFWLQFIPSPPFRRRMPLVSQAAALLGTNLVMIVHRDGAEHLRLALGVLGLRPRARRHPAAVRRPADRRGDPVGMRRLLGHAVDDRDRQAADPHRREHHRGAGQGPEPRRVTGGLGYRAGHGSGRTPACWAARRLSGRRRPTASREPAAGARGGRASSARGRAGAGRSGLTG